MLYCLRGKKPEAKEERSKKHVANPRSKKQEESSEPQEAANTKQVACSMQQVGRSKKQEARSK